MIVATLRDVAKLAGVSTATASNALSGRKRVSEAVEARVREAARALGYFRNGAAASLRTGRSRTLGLVLPDLQNPYFPALVRSIEHRARQHGYSLLLMDVDSDPATEARAFRLLSEKGVDGALWIPQRATPPEGLPYPVVAVDRPVAGLDSVFADHEAGGRLLAQLAVRLGHERVALLSGPQSMSSARLRRRGFLDAFPRGVAWEVEAPFDLRLPAEARRALARGGVTLVVCASDVVAVAALQVLGERGVLVPQEVSVAGFDDIPWAPLVTPKLTTVRQPLDRLGRTAVEVLMGRMAEPNGPRATEMIPVELVARESTAPRLALEAAP